MLPGRLRRSRTTGKQREAKQTSGDLDFHSLDSVNGETCRQLRRVYNYYNPLSKGKHFFPYKKRPTIGFNFATVAAGQRLRSVTKAASSAECSGQFGSAGRRGIIWTITFFAVSAFAIK